MELIPNAAVPCCNIQEVEVAEEWVLGNIGEKQEVRDVGTRLMEEEVVLRANLENMEAVEGALARLQQLESKIKAQDILDSEIIDVVYNDVREKYSVATLAGRQVRRILNKLINIAKSSPDVDVDETLPDITFVEEEEEEQMPDPRPKKTLAGLFRNRKHNVSTILAQPLQEGVVEAVQTFIRDLPVCSTVEPRDVNELLENMAHANQDPETLPSEVGASSVKLTFVDKGDEQMRELPKKKKRKLSRR